MGNVLENSLYVQRPDKFQDLSGEVIRFNNLYNGSNIIQDDIFSILTNYSRKKGVALELLRFPTDDEDFCALTCVQKGKIFVYVNSGLPLSNQIFAAAHELYHIWRFVEAKDESVLRKGSFLSAATMDDARSNEDREANAFAGLFLVPYNALCEQMKIYEIPMKGQTLEDIIQLMAIFSVPYKAILLCLYEENCMDKETVQGFLSVEKNELKKTIGYLADADRWQKNTPEVIRFGSLKKLMEQNKEQELLADSRFNSDQAIYQQILHRYGNHRG